MSDEDLRVGEAVYARALATARELNLPTGASRSELISALARCRIVLPSMRMDLDDTRDLDDVVRVIPPGALRVPPAGWRIVAPKIPSPEPYYTIRVRAVLCADSDGKNAVGVNQGHLPDLLKDLSSLYAHAGLGFVLATTVTLADTTINQDFTVPSGLDFTSTTQPMAQADIDSSFDKHNAARSAWARKYPGELVIFFRYGTKFRWDDTAKKWYIGPASFAFSGPEHEFVVMGPGNPPEHVLLAHEAGHYFHLGHTHNDLVTLTEAEAKQYSDWQNNAADQSAGANLLRARLVEGIRSFVDDKGNPPELGLNVLDADHLADTPPDPGPSLFRYEFGDACASKSVTVDVNLKTGVRSYTVTANLDLIMSYFFRCAGNKRFTGAQIGLLRKSLETTTFTTTVTTPAGNTLPILSRHHLIAPKYTVAGPGNVVALPPKGFPRLRRWLRTLTRTGRRP